MTRYRQLFGLILLLFAVAAFVVWKIPMRRGLDLAGGMRLVYEAQPKQGQRVDARMRSTIVSILENRINPFGVVDPVVQPKGERQFIVEVPDIKQKDELARELAEPTDLEFRHFSRVQNPRNPNAPYEMTVSEDDDGRPEYTFTDSQGNDVPVEKVIEESPVIVTGADLKSNATANIEGLNKPVVYIEFKEEGRKKFADFTRRRVDEWLAIILNGQILSVPKINEPILKGQASITGMETAEKAQRLADFLNAGALPVPLTVVEQNFVEASLGKQYVSQSLWAGVYGLIAVVIFMMVYYLFPGVLATIALAMYALFTFAVFKGMNVTMTLPGLAGFILSIGMAVDANILIFERLKEELRAGKTLHSAIDTGFNRAWTAILDSNVCTLITCAILIALSSGPVVGFAKTLAIGVLISMFTAITVTRTLLHVATGVGFAQNPRLYGLGMQWGSHGGRLNVIGKRPIWFGISGVLIVLAAFFLATEGLKPGIEFQGGSLMQVSSQQRLTSSGIRNAMAGTGTRPEQIQLSEDMQGTSLAFVRTKQLSVEGVQKVRDAIEKGLPGANVESTSIIGPSISREITQKAVLAVILALVLIVIYLSVRFAQAGYADGFKFGACAFLALSHDVMVALGASALFGKLLGWEIDGAYITAVLTMVGYSVHDTIVVFDRIRENQKLRLKGETFEQLVNRSILQTFARSINTSLTVVMVLVTLLLFGGSGLRHFTAVLLIGIVVGTYSSIFVASPLLVVWEKAARKSRGQLTPAEMKPLVERPTEEARRLVGETAPAEAEEDLAATAAERSETAKAKARPTTKRRKRRF